MSYQIVSDNFSFVNYVEIKLLGSVYESVTTMQTKTTTWMPPEYRALQPQLNFSWD